MLDWNPLLLTVLGGLLAVLGGVVSAKIATRHAGEMFSKERELSHEERAGEVRSYLLAELRLNLKLVGDMLGPAYVTLLTDAWCCARGDAKLLGRKAEGRVTATYAQIHRYNDGARAYDPNFGTKRVLDDAVRDLRPMIEACIKVLESPESDAISGKAGNISGHES
jgi:hypothetical protein